MVMSFLRKRKNMKRIMWVLAILIIPAFVIWGSGSVGKKKEGPDYAGKVFGKKVSFEEYADMWRVTRNYLVESMGQNIPPEFIDQMTWNRILLLHAAKKERISVKDSEVAEKIMSFPVFQRNGYFDKELYKSMLGDAARGFEEKLRDDLRISKLRERVTGNISVTDEEVEKAYRQKHEKVKLSYVSVPFSGFTDEVSYEENDLVEYFEKNKTNFRKPERINVKYIEIPFSAFTDEIFITEESVKRYFEENISEFKKPDSEEMPVLDDSIKKTIKEKLAMEKQISLAEETAYKALDKTLGENDLSEGARLFSLKIKETGFFSARDEIPGIGWLYPFVKTGFELKKNEISKVMIRGGKAFYIIQLKDKKPSYLPEFDEVKDEVKEAFVRDLSIKLAEKRITKIKIYIDNNLEEKNTLGQIAQVSGLNLKKTDYLTRDGYIEGLGPARSAVDECSALAEGDISEPVRMSDSWAIFRLDEYQDIDEIQFLEEKEKFRSELLERKREDFFNNWFVQFKRKADFVSYTDRER